MITHYSAITFISAFAMLVMVFCVQNSQFTSHYRKRGFQLLFCLLMITDFSEWLAASLIGASAEWHTLLVAAKFTELLLTPFVPFVAMAAISGSRNPAWKAVPAAVNVFLQICSLFSGWVFTVDAANQYARGPLYLFYSALFLAEAVMLIFHCLHFSRHYQYASIQFLVLINILVLLAVFMEFYAPYLRLDWVCVSYAAILFFIYSAQLIQQVDPLTGLLNRRSFDCAIGDVRASVTIVFFDVDHFKEVNDVHGHKFGDECLRSVAQEIRASFERFGYCYRYGGDEFCAILYRNTEHTDELLSAYFARVRTLRAKEPRIPCVSAGYAKYDAQQETIEDAVHRADEMMYRYKQLHRERPVS